MVNGVAQQSNFHQYRVLRMSDMPEIKVEIITGNAPIPSMVARSACRAPRRRWRTRSSS